MSIQAKILVFILVVLSCLLIQFFDRHVMQHDLHYLNQSSVTTID